MKIVCADSLTYGREAFSTLGDVAVLPGRAISAPDVREAGVLAIRSTTPVSAALLAGSAVRFVGTATIGIDHLDTRWMDEHGVRWCFAPGCNAVSVAEYLAAALLHLAGRHHLVLKGRTLGIIGVGNVGRRVAGIASALGLKVLLNDPPREAAEPGNRIFSALDPVLAQADIVTLHVPLTQQGPHATRHMADEAFFARLKRGGIFINAARGPVVDTPALIRALDTGIVAHAVIDTWEGEPGFSGDLMRRCDIGTPHIAGYSFDGKVEGTAMIYREACRLFGREAVWSPDALLPDPPVPVLDIDATGRGDEDVMREAALAVYDIGRDDAGLRSAADAPDPEKRAVFDGLRKHYPERREFRFTRINLRHGSAELKARLAGMGFRVEALP